MLTRWAALLGGINAGRKLPMADFRAFLADQGLRGVRTLLASGNAVFEAQGDANALAARLRPALARALGVDTAWFLRSHAELAAIVAANPFPDAAATHPNHLLVHFHAADVPADRLSALVHDGPERLHAIGRELYVDYPDDVGHSKLPQAMARAKFPKEATARNWNTVLKLVEATG